MAQNLRPYPGRISVTRWKSQKQASQREAWDSKPLGRRHSKVVMQVGQSFMEPSSCLHRMSLQLEPKGQQLVALPVE